MMQYRYCARDGELLRYDNEKDIHEGYNWKQKKWEECPEAVDASLGVYDGFLHKITDAQAEQIIREKVPGKRFDMDRLK